MCGICGIVRTPGTEPTRQDRLLAMRDVMTHRGPDDCGYYIDECIGLGSRRLSILDLSERGRMPMSTPDGNLQIVHNGEIYNFQELRATLEAKGYVFRSNTDTEVLLYLYQEHGAELLEKLNGIFAFAIWDNQERKLFLARDHLGVKPLYYALHRGKFYFASEAKALIAAGIPAQFDPSVWEELLLFRCVAGEQTVFTGIRRLLPGHYLLWENGSIQVRRWWRLDERVRAARENLPVDPIAWYRETFDQAIEMQRISDVPLGVLLSGGLDSSSVAAALARQVGSGVASFTVRFREPGYDEGPIAQTVAERWHLKYYELRLSPKELLGRMHKAAWLNDEPLMHQNDVHIWAIAEFAKQHVTVLLSGEGGDETLGGYVRYQPLRYPALLSAVAPVLPRLASRLHWRGRLKKLSRFLELGSIDDFVLFNACEYLPSDLRGLGLHPTLDYPYRRQVLAEAAALYPNEPIRQAIYLDHHIFLPTVLDRNDRMTMGASIECRVPFLDYRLVEKLAALPSSILLAGHKTKSVLRKALGERLPDEVLNHRKWGFGVPWGVYLRQSPELRQLVHDLPQNEPFASGPLDRRHLQQLVDAFLDGQSQHELLIRQLFMILIWNQAYFSDMVFVKKAR